MFINTWLNADYSINDLLDEDLTPVLVIMVIIAFIIIVALAISANKSKNTFNNLPTQSEKNVKVLSVDKGTATSPGIATQCTIVFERNNGTRLALRSRDNSVYDIILVGDRADICFKQGILINYQSPPVESRPFVATSPVQPKQPVASPVKRVYSDEDWICPQCGKSHQGVFISCPCGYKKPPINTSTKSTSAGSETPHGVWSCPVCGKKNISTSDTCWDCGAKK